MVRLGGRRDQHDVRSADPAEQVAEAGLTTSPPSYIAARTTQVTLPDGQAFTLRPVVPDDRALFAAAFESLSPESRYRRFFSPLAELTPDVLTDLTEVDYHDHFAWVALVEEAGTFRLAGVARYVRRPERSTAEAAVTVLDLYQGRGLGDLLVAALIAEALEHGVSRFDGEVLAENDAVRAMLDAAGARLDQGESGVVHFELDLPGLCTEHKTYQATLASGAHADPGRGDGK